MEMTELDGGSCAPGSRATWKRSSATRRRGSAASCRDRFEVSFGNERSAPSCSAGWSWATGSPCPARSTASTSIRSGARRSSRTTSPARPPTRRAEIEKELRLQIPLYMLVLRDLIGIEPLGGVYRPLAGDRRARGLLRARRARTTLPGFVTNDYLDEDAFWAQVEGAREHARGARRPHPRRRRAARPEGRRVPGVVRALVDVPGEARMSVALNPEQAAAVEARGPRLRLRRRRHREDGRARRALRPRGLRRGRRRRLDARHHVHASAPPASCARASARELRRARAARPRARARRRLDLDHPRLLQPAAEGVPVRGRARPALPRARRGAGPRCCAARPSRRALDAFCAERRRPTGCGCSRPTAAAGCGGC